MILHCAQHSHPPNPERAETRSCPRRPPLHRGGSASKKDAWLLALPIFPRLVLLPARWPELAPHREHLNGQAFLYFSPYGRASVVVPPRPSSEHILIVRAPGAEDHTGFRIYLSPSWGAAWLNPQLRASIMGLPTLSTSIKGSGQGCPLLRASSDHRFIVGALRARRAPGRSLPRP